MTEQIYLGLLTARSFMEAVLDTMVVVPVLVVGVVIQQEAGCGVLEPMEVSMAAALAPSSSGVSSVGSSGEGAGHGHTHPGMRRRGGGGRAVTPKGAGGGRRWRTGRSGGSAGTGAAGTARGEAGERSFMILTTPSLALQRRGGEALVGRQQAEREGGEGGEGRGAGGGEGGGVQQEVSEGGWGH